jgi:type IX secretion system PorP/SprF family membrane protein
MQRIFLLLAFILFFAQSRAQVDPLYAQYMNNPLLINPAYTGLNDQFSASVSYRKQWAGFDGSPTTINLSAHSSLNKNQMGAGLIVLKDNIGVSTNTEVQASYAYKINLNHKIISFGLQGGVVNYHIKNNDLNIYDPNDPAFATMNVMKPSIGAGMIFTSERYFFGISVPRLLQPTAASAGEQFELYSRHFYAIGSYVFYPNENLKIKPSVLVKGVSGSQLSVDLNMTVILKDQFTVGTFTRNFGTYGFLSQLKIGDQYKVGYVLEVPTGRSVGTQFTSHEVTLGVNMNLFTFHNLNKVVIF